LDFKEATLCLVLLFLKALGYDVFDPNIVVPEFIADIGRKKGEKVDYAIMQDEKPLVLIEVKNHKETLDNYKTSLNGILMRKKERSSPFSQMA